jgi:hypothetical protein
MFWEKMTYHGVSEIAVSESITRRALNTEHGADFSCTNFLYFLHIIGVHAHNLRYPNLLV